MNISELDSYNLADAVKFNEQLNPRIWQGNKMRPEVRAKLLQIAEDFKQSLGLTDLNLKDITLSGSNAGYTYTPHSDIDLHLVVDLPQADVSDVYRELFDAKKFQYNETHNIKIGGYDVELYVENANKSAVSQGIFSVVNDDWINIPLKKRSTINDNVVKSKYDVIKNHIESAIESADLERLTNTAAKIKKMRQTGLDRNGELGPENLAYKMLRSQGVIKKLYDARTAAKDQELSLRERTIQVKKPFRYGFRATEDVSSNPNGVSPETKMFLSEKPALSQQEIVTDFVNYCVEQLGIEQLPAIKFKRDPEWSARNKTFGRYNHETNLLEVSLAGRHVMDILRTVAHELTHQRQHEVADVPDHAGETGSEWENEANARAGVLMREYAQQHPEFFADESVSEAGILGFFGSNKPVKKQWDPTRDSRVISNHKDDDSWIKLLLDKHRRGISLTDREWHSLQQWQRQQIKKKNTAESSGYIPTKKQANDPRFKMALTRDIRPGAVGKEANKLNLQTDSQGRPALLMKTANQMHEELANDLRWEFALLEQEFLGEINMSPSSLRELSAQTGALAGMEFEMCVPSAGDNNDGDQEPDYNFDQRCRSIQDARDFFYDGDFNSRRDIENMSDRMQNDYAEWLYERIDRDFVNESEYLISEWIANNVDESEWNPDDLEGEARQEALDEFISNVDADPSNDYYQKVLDEYREENQDSYDESDWLDAEDLDLMSGVENAYSINWPHWRSTGGGEASIEEVADSFRDAVGRPILASTSYHSGRVERPSTTNLQYIVEPDSSIDVDDSDDQGLEFVSPPLPIEELLSDLNKVKAWADRTGCYTNDSTGLHINVSVPGWTQGTDQLDYVKLALLLGDEFVLDSFGRAGNTYAKSAMGKIQSMVRQNPNSAQELMDKMKSGMDQLASKVVHSRSTDKYTSINVKNGYIEFRSPGGDWLNDNFKEIDNTLRRFTVALSAAVDPEAYRQEYLKKLYKLLDVNSEKDPLSYFAKYAAGELPKAALKSFVRQAQLERDVKRDKTGGKKMWWSVTNPPQSSAGIEVVATTREEAIEKALGADGYPAWANTRQSIVAKPLRPYEEKPAQQSQPPQGVDTRVDYELYSRASGAVIDTFPARNDDEAITRLSDYINFGAGQSNPDNFDVRRAGRAPIAGSTLDLQRQRAAAAQIPTIDIDVEPAPAPQQPGTGQWNGQWKVLVGGREVYRFGGIGNSQADANRIAAAWLRSNGQGVSGEGFEVYPVMAESLREYKMPQPSQGPGRYRELNEPLGPETPPRMPAGTIKVDVSDTQDWYQLGQDISNLDIANKAHYNQGPPHTVLAFGSEDLEHMYIQQLKRLGLNTHDLDEPGEDDLDEGVKSALATAALAGTMAMGAQAKAPNMVQQIVEPGDTVYSIARQNNVNPLEIYRLNKMDRNTKLEVGQRVVVLDYSKPVSKIPATVAPTVKQPPAQAAPPVAQAASTLKDKISSFMPKMPTDTEGVVLLSDNPDAEAALQTAAKAAGLKGSELAQFMAQTRHESWDFGKMKEVGNKKTFAKYEKPRLAKQLGNKVKGDGERFKGRGFIQLTGRDNYTRASQQIFGDDRLVKNPDLATRLDVGAQIALWFWKNQVRPAVKDFNNTTQVVKAINADEPAKVVQARHNKFKEYMAVL